MSSLSSFLKERRTAFLDAVQSGKGEDWTVVMGNEAGDLDSIASSIAYAWYASNTQRKSVIALTQTPRSELHLRAENLYAFELARINPETDILCIDDVPHSPDSPFPSNTFALVDHNRLNPRFARPESDTRVVAVIDHHEDEGLYQDTAVPRHVVVPTGSCASLVTDLFAEQAERGDPQLPPELAKLLLCSILIDTGGLKPGGKAQEADHRAARFLIPRAAPPSPFDEQSNPTAIHSSQHPSSISSSSAPSIAAANGETDSRWPSMAGSEEAPYEIPGLRQLHAALQGKKSSVSHLGTADLLKRDYKQYTMSPAQSPDKHILVGLASVPLGFESWLPNQADFWSQTERFMTESGLEVLGILTSFYDTKKLGKSGHGKHRREQMYIVHGDKEFATTLFDALEEAEELKLKRRKFPEYGVGNGFGHGFHAHVWKQKNVEATRKTTAPLLKSIVEGQPRGSSL